MLAEVRLWDRTIGAVSWDDTRNCALFEYDRTFAQSGIHVAPLTMPLGPEVYRFPELDRATFRGLPGMLADALPDAFGNALIDAWLARKGRSAASFSPIERLCYTGTRGMGALEFKPSEGPRSRPATRIEVSEMVRLASEILAQRDGMRADLSKNARDHALPEILRVGTSAGGARAKAVIAWHPQTNDVRSGQITPGDGYEHWLIKFDGVSGNRDRELADPQGYGAIEYAYSLMARAAGIKMSECRLLEENGRRHFMTRRFDRTADGHKLHMQTLGAIAHYDFGLAGAYGYEQALLVIRRLGLGVEAVEQQFRRMVFNVMARNQDDHVKNIAFLMDKSGRWSLAPAYDVIHSYNPAGEWTSQHQMTVNGKRDGFTGDDLRAVAATARISRARGLAIVEEVRAAVTRWEEFAEHAKVRAEQITAIAADRRLSLR